MAFVITLTAMVAVALIAVILINPVIKVGRFSVHIIYWFVPLLGALVLLLGGLLSPGEVFNGLTSSGNINPLKILVLFISMTVLSIYLDEAGMFRFLAGIALKKARSSQIKLFIYLYVMVSVLTVFTSNDIIILTFTPFICYFSKNAKINPMPFLFTEFVAANTWSMMLIIGNPTNIYLAGSAGMTFFGYTSVMALPTLLAGLGAFLLLYLSFRKDLSKPLSIEADDYKIENPVLMWIGVAHLGICTVLLVLSSYIGLEMWYITLGFAVSLFICSGIAQFMQKKEINRSPAPGTEHILIHTLRRAPWELIPFVLSMFLIVLSLNKYGVTAVIADAFGDSLVLLKYGIASFLTANLVNNIPMSVAFSSITSHLAGEGNAYLKAVFAAIVGSNLGALFTPIGALAGIMWSSILKRFGIEFTFGKFVKYGAPIALGSLALAILGLWLVL